MLAYFDTSAFVPLLLNDEYAPDCRQAWVEADIVMATRLLYVESVAALRRANRQGRLPDEGVRPSISRLRTLWENFRVIEFDLDLAERAGGLAWRFGLRGFDAVHCAAAALVQERDQIETDGTGSGLVAIAGDRELLAAWRDLGIATFEPAA